MTLWRRGRHPQLPYPAAVDVDVRRGPEGPGPTIPGIRTAILTVSTSVASRSSEDRSGPALAGLAEEAGCDIVAMEVVPDDFALIEDRLHHYVDTGCDLVFTTGGTGMTPDDITPEATRAVIHREAPGLAEAMRTEGARHTPLGILARGIAGIAEATLIVNFPGSPKAIEQLFPVIKERVRAVVTVTDEEIVAAMRFAFERLRLVLEPSGASALAALLHGKVDAGGRRTGVVLSGGNVDVARFRDLVG